MRREKDYHGKYNTGNLKRVLEEKETEKVLWTEWSGKASH